MPLSQIKQPLLLLLICIFLCAQWSNGHIHLNTSHEHAGSQHQHTTQNHNHSLTNHHADLIDSASLQDHYHSAVVQTDQPCRSTEKSYQLDIETITADHCLIINQPLVQLTPTQYTQHRPNKLNHIIQPRAPPHLA